MTKRLKMTALAVLLCGSGYVLASERMVAVSGTAVSAQPVAAAVTVAGPESAGAGTVIEISWTGPEDDSNYITVVAAGAKPTEYNDYTRISRGSPLKVQVPDAVGDHEIRYIDQSAKVVLAMQPIMLTPVAATVSAPATAPAGSHIEVDWTGPRTPGDYITVVEAGAPDNEYNDYVRVGNTETVSVQVPDELGNYEVRYILNLSKRVLAAAPVVLEPVSATLDIQNRPVPGGNVAVAWTGPKNRGDYIAVAARSAPHKYLTYTRVGDKPVVSLKVPDTEGDYLLTYVINSSKRILASTPLTLAQAAGSVTAPSSVAAGTVISVEWTGPSNRNDFIEIVAADAQEDARPLAATRTAQGSPLSLHAPAIPGAYTIRYMMRDTKEVLASASVEVE